MFLVFISLFIFLFVLTVLKKNISCPIHRIRALVCVCARILSQRFVFVDFVSDLDSSLRRSCLSFLKDKATKKNFGSGHGDVYRVGMKRDPKRSAPTVQRLTAHPPSSATSLRLGLLADLSDDQMWKVTHREKEREREWKGKIVLKISQNKKKMK